MKSAGSFRDPAGFIFERDGHLLRQINDAGRADYDHFMSSGLYQELADAGLLIPHTDTGGAPNRPGAAYKVIRPERVGFISYPYEWSFSQFKDAALTTLEIQRLSLAKGMVLKDASAYNIQFHQGRPVLIDTLSFAKYEPGKPWAAYKQFAQHFLAPLALMATVDPGLQRLLTVYIDGIPLPLAAKLLPRRSLLSPGLLMHLTLHAGAQSMKAGEGSKGARPQPTLSRTRLEALIDSLTRTVRRLQWKPARTEWGDYYTFTNYSDEALNEKKRLVAELISQVKPKSTWDLGGNDGTFSRLASDAGSNAVCFDIDPVAVEKNYRHTKSTGETNHLPLLLDLTNPSPAIGWANAERDTLAARGPVDLVMALALIHHLAISNNVPLPGVASYFASLGTHLIIEFVPKSDSKVQILLASRPDIFPDYTPAGFEAAFSRYFTIVTKVAIPGTKRTLYLMKRRPTDEN